MTESLFDDLPAPEGEPPPVARVALERGIDRLLDYVVPKSLAGSIAVGQRVVVPLGRRDRPAFGFVAAVQNASEYGRLKPVRSIADPRGLVVGPLLELALWISRYYFTPLGVVLESIIPSAVRKRVGLRNVRAVRPLLPPPQLQELLEKTTARKRRALLGRVLQIAPGESVALHKLAHEAGVKPPAIKALVKAGVIAIEEVAAQQFDKPNRPQPVSPEPTTLPTLSPEQSATLDMLTPRLSGGFGVHLLHGVTGSGKTEVYLRAIQHVVAGGRGAIVLVPEIALTPQTVRRFVRRFERVAVMHSGLSGAKRHSQWHQIASGGADIVVGARSAIFAPHPRLGIIVVDEEHESSYKQDQAPRYHARDVAIKRAQLESIPILLGSATPSLEMWAKVRRPSDTPQTHPPDSSSGPTPALADVYHLHSMPTRINTRPLPAVEVIDMKQANRDRRGIHLLSPRLEAALRNTLEHRQQAILLLNRRGYSNFIYCGSCQTPVSCKYCDKTMTYHRAVALRPDDRSTAAATHAGQIHCHYCLAVNKLPEVCPTCGKRLTLFGLGTQRVEEELAGKFADLRFARVDSDTMRSSRDYEELLDAFGRGDLQVLLGTQMLAKGLDFANVTLVGVINGDTALSLPDFRAAERTFQLITQVAGRAGRGDLPGRVIVQTFLPDDPTIRAAASQDYHAFAAAELVNRRSVNLPPYARQARIVARDIDQQKLQTRIEDLAAALREAINRTAAPVSVRGPMPAVVGRIAGYYRAQVLISSASAKAIQSLMSSMRESKKLVSGDRLAIDIDPISML